MITFFFFFFRRLVWTQFVCWGVIKKNTARRSSGSTIKRLISVNSLPVLGLITSMRKWQHEFKHAWVPWSDPVAVQRGCLFPCRQRIFRRGGEKKKSFWWVNSGPRRALSETQFWSYFVLTFKSHEKLMSRILKSAAVQSTPCCLDISMLMSGTLWF